MNGPVKVKVRTKPLTFDVVIDPMLEKRGHCFPPVVGIYEPPKIKLRRWDEEVFLHECLHALMWTGEFRLGDEREEEIVGHLSHGLHAIGFRLEPSPPECEEEP